MINSTRKAGVLIGVLFLLAMAVYMIGSEMVLAALDQANQFASINKSSLQIGILLEFFNSAAVVGIAALFYPILKKFNPPIAMLYAAARCIEAVLLLICSVLALTIALFPPEVSASLGGAMLTLRELLFQMAMVSLGAGSIFMCWLLLTSRLLPRWLAGLGVVGYAALTVSGFLGLFGNPQLGMVLFAPGAIFEIGLPIWLFIKGFAVTEPQISAI